MSVNGILSNSSADIDTSGTVTSVSVVTANGLAGTVATATTTPAITLSTTATGILTGNGTAISSAAGINVDTNGYANLGVYSSTNPTTPAAGNTIFARQRCGTDNFSTIDPNGLMNEMAPIYGTKNITWHKANGHSSSSTTSTGAFVVTVAATAGGVTYAPSSILGSFVRLKSTSSAATAQSVGVIDGVLRWCSGSAAGCGGYFLIHRFSLDAIAASQAWFCGITGSTTDMGDVDPSSVTNMIGIGCDAGDTNAQFMHNDSSGTATKVDLGVNFPGKTSGVIYELRLFCAPNGSTVYYSVQRIDVAQFTEGNTATDLPSNTTILAFQLHGGTRAVGTAVVVGWQLFYGESEF